MKLYFLIGGDRSLNEALNQVMKLEATKVAAEIPARISMRQVTGVLEGKRPPPAKRLRDGRSLFWHYGNASQLSRDCRRGPKKEVLDNKTGNRIVLLQEEPARERWHRHYATPCASLEAANVGSYCSFGKAEEAAERKLVEDETAQMVKKKATCATSRGKSNTIGEQRQACSRRVQDIAATVGTVPPLGGSSWLVTTWADDTGSRGCTAL